jgi:hypothetical protein
MSRRKTALFELSLARNGEVDESAAVADYARGVPLSGDEHKQSQERGLVMKSNPMRRFTGKQNSLFYKLTDELARRSNFQRVYPTTATAKSKCYAAYFDREDRDADEALNLGQAYDRFLAMDFAYNVDDIERLGVAEHEEEYSEEEESEEEEVEEEEDSTFLAVPGATVGHKEEADNWQDEEAAEAKAQETRAVKRLKRLDNHSTLPQVLAQPRGREAFLAFLNKELSSENLTFWEAVNTFAQESSPPQGKDALLQYLNNLINMYILPDSFYQVNIPAFMLDNIKSKVKSQLSR